MRETVATKLPLQVRLERALRAAFRIRNKTGFPPSFPPSFPHNTVQTGGMFMQSSPAPELRHPEVKPFTYEENRGAAGVN